MSVVAQIAIDNAKRSFDIDLVEEIKRIKTDMEVKHHGYPVFWNLIHKDFNSARINKNLVCPMNYLYLVRIPKIRKRTTTIPMSEFLINHPIDQSVRVRKSRKVEELITKYSFKLKHEYNINVSASGIDSDKLGETYIVLRNDFDDLIKDIEKVNISRNYLGLMRWLINRAFIVNYGVQNNIDTLKAKTKRNRAILIKTLFDVNKNIFLQCFKQ